jgi:hypothetical protein
VPWTLASHDRSVTVSNETIRCIRRELESLRSGRELSSRIVGSDPGETIQLSDEESDLIQQAADYAIKRNPVSPMRAELHSLRMLRALSPPRSSETAL